MPQGQNCGLLVELFDVDLLKIMKVYLESRFAVCLASYPTDLVLLSNLPKIQFPQILCVYSIL